MATFYDLLALLPAKVVMMLTVLFVIASMGWFYRELMEDDT